MQAKVQAMDVAMSEPLTLRTVCRLLAAIAIAFAAATLAPAPAKAQQVILLVNGDPITNFDIEQRAKLIQLSTNKAPSRQAVIDELIDEKLKIQQLLRYGIENMDNDVNVAFGNMARRMRMTAAQFADQLAKSGVGLGTLKSRIKAEITWTQIIRGRYQSAFQFSEKDILAKMEAKGDKSLIGYDYTMRPILFVLPKQTPESVAARKKEAEALRAKFQGCEEGLALVRGLRDVAIRNKVVRSSADLPPSLREILEKTEMGKLTAPEVTAQGVEVYALCDKQPSGTDNAPGRREVREQMATEQFQMLSKRYLAELRSQAMIEYKDKK